jgi:hypothetical protein
MVQVQLVQLVQVVLELLVQRVLQLEPLELPQQAQPVQEFLA